MSADHKRPLYAFVIVAIMCALIIANALRSQAVMGVLQAGVAPVVPGLQLHHREPAEPPVLAVPEPASPPAPAASSSQSPSESRSSASAGSPPAATSTHHAAAGASAHPAQPQTAQQSGHHAGQQAGHPQAAHQPGPSGATTPPVPPSSGALIHPFTHPANHQVGHLVGQVGHAVGHAVGHLAGPGGPHQVFHGVAGPDGWRHGHSVASHGPLATALGVTAHQSGTATGPGRGHGLALGHLAQVHASPGHIAQVHLFQASSPQGHRHAQSHGLGLGHVLRGPLEASQAVHHGAPWAGRGYSHHGQHGHHGQSHHGHRAHQAGHRRGRPGPHGHAHRHAG